MASAGQSMYVPNPSPRVARTTEDQNTASTAAKAAALTASAVLGLRKSSRTAPAAATTETTTSSAKASSSTGATIQYHPPPARPSICPRQGVKSSGKAESQNWVSALPGPGLDQATWCQLLDCRPGPGPGEDLPASLTSLEDAIASGRPCDGDWAGHAARRADALPGASISAKRTCRRRSLTRQGR